MSAEKSGRLLIIDGDELLCQTLAQHFGQAGYEVDSASRGQAGINLALSARPNLILLSAQLPDMTGLDVFRVLRDKPRTGHIPVMILAGKSETLLQHTLLEEGAYDFIEKPIDVDILGLRVRNALRRAEREGFTEPRTGLPTGRLIDEQVEALAGRDDWYKIELTIDSFSVFRELYGFVTANEALRFAGNLITQVVNEIGSPEDFVGHPNGSESFVIITTLAHGPRLRQALVQRLGRELLSFYNFVEREQGYVLVEDGAGGQVQRPLMAARVEVAQSGPTPEPDEEEWDTDEPDGPDDSSAGSAFEW